MLQGTPKQADGESGTVDESFLNDEHVAQNESKDDIDESSSVDDVLLDVHTRTQSERKADVFGESTVDDSLLLETDTSVNRSLHRALHENDASSSSDPEATSVALLREIFPDQTEDELRQLHEDRLRSSAKKKRPTSNLGHRIWNLLQEDGQQRELPQVTLPDDFLRIPAPHECQDEQLLNDLEQRVLAQHRDFQQTQGRAITYPLDEDCCYSLVISRDAQGGLGMTLCEEGGCIWVHSLLGQDGVRWFRPAPDPESGGPALRAGIQPGDWLLGIQGEALLPTSHKLFLRHAVSSVQHAEDPVVLHLQRVPLNGLHPLAGSGPSLLDTTIESIDTAVSDETAPSVLLGSDGRPIHRIHPFVRALASKGLIRRKKDEIEASKSLAQFTQRARQWESASSFRIDAHTYELHPHFDPQDLPPSLSEDTLPFQYEEAKSIHPYARSTPTLDPNVDPIPIEYLDIGDISIRSSDDDQSEERGLLRMTPSPKRKQKSVYPGDWRHSTNTRPALQPSDVLIPLMGVRKALCVRILNTFIEENRTAYTIWVYDVESGREWYAPVRYLCDFQELRSATLHLCPSIAHIPFPAGGWRAFGVREKSEPDSVRDAKCRQLENFLRTLCVLIYTEPLHPDIAEIAIHVQSFLGCDSGLSQGGESTLQLQNYAVMNEPMCGPKAEEGHSVLQMNIRLLLKRSIQRYTYRVFLLDVMKHIVDDFVTQARATGPTLKEIEILEARGRSALKDRALGDLENIQAFLDQMQELILEGCSKDFESIARRRDFFALHEFLDGKKGDVYLEQIIREAVREQIEIEVYVPLRSVVSRLLVNGWKHDDMEIHFKMQVLKKRPQTMFKIPEDKHSRSGWRSVSAILNEGVGMSTLPCAKLRAIVDAAKEIIRVYSVEHESKPETESNMSTEDAEEGEATKAVRKSALGADDILPIFIYSVVQADMERPCALCVLLQTLCDKTNRIGETGYYLASFEGAIAHIQELDLTLDKELTS